MAEKKAAEIVARLANRIQVRQNRQLALEIRREEVRLQIEQGVEAAVREHNETDGLLLPEAQQKLDVVVKPWWQDVIRSGLFDQILAWVQQTDRWHARASDKFMYIAPYTRLTALNQARTGHQLFKPFEWEARDLIKTPDDVLTDEKLFELSGRADEWSTYFCIGRRLGRRKGEIWDTGLYASFQRVGQDAGSGGIVPLDLNNPTELFTKKVACARVIGFAEQIRSGRVWNILERSLAGRED